MFQKERKSFSDKDYYSYIQQFDCNSFGYLASSESLFELPTIVRQELSIFRNLTWHKLRTSSVFALSLSLLWCCLSFVSRLSFTSNSNFTLMNAISSRRASPSEILIKCVKGKPLVLDKTNTENHRRQAQVGQGRSHTALNI